MPRTSSPGGGQSEGQVAPRGYRLPQAAQDQYWEIVKQTLEKVFGIDPAEALRRVNELRQKISDLKKPETETVFYHAEPFDVAEDLASLQSGQLPTQRQITTTQRNDYLDIKGVSPADRP
jgi:hypothetical protein